MCPCSAVRSGGYDERVDSMERAVTRGNPSPHRTPESWARYAAACFGAAAALLTATVGSFLLGAVGTGFAAGAGLVATALLAFGLHARRRADAGAPRG